jgi:hypothetical protein
MSVQILYPFLIGLFLLLLHYKNYFHILDVNTLSSLWFVFVQARLSEAGVQVCGECSSKEPAELTEQLKCQPGNEGSEVRGQ